MRGPDEASRHTAAARLAVRPASAMLYDMLFD